MAFPKKGSRKIVVNGIKYLWRLNVYDFPQVHIKVMVQACEGGEIWSRHFDEGPVTPKMVEDLVKENNV